MIKIALPAGDLRPPIGRLLSSCGLRVEGYAEGSRSYRLAVEGREDVAARVFREKDIPIQVALGNYDLGVCSLAWVKEIQARFKQRAIVPLRDLELGALSLVAMGATSACDRLDKLGSLPVVRIASDYPNLADAFAKSARLARYRVQGVWGAAEAYPPEDADVAIVAVSNPDALSERGLAPLFELLHSSVWLIGNVASLGRRDLSSVLNLFNAANGNGAQPAEVSFPTRADTLGASVPLSTGERDMLRLAIPDGHQQRHVQGALEAAGLLFDGYNGSTPARRPRTDVDGLEVKVIRPHDMPQLVAAGEVDVAITGRDCLMEHLYSFPSSPAAEVLDLQRGQYNLAAVVGESLPANTIGEVMDLWRHEGRDVLRIASEFPATADHYARSRHFWRYQVISIAGASEGFVPEDADLLIEGTETGKTLVENKLKVIDLLYRSTTCVIANKNASLQRRKRIVYDELLTRLRRVSEVPESV